MINSCLSILAWLVVLVITLPTPASAEVRFGRGVRIGGHDVSNQTFNRQRRGEFSISNNTIFIDDRDPLWAGFQLKH